ncbi:hypothetical protein PML89_09555 (plasmid) [Vagococcus lutrae]|uniref:hypothetical protein n=1 Tax=Vagococcus TaxID=2737 RepID=UPI000EE3352B|nr:MULTISPECIES: hypothetical protein [Vagococcus]WCG06069.1 hypothetical protein PML89_09555 [Vagococcus lutrae]HCT96505.1 hypothetical protein [Vagococcus sp.]
MNGKYVVKIGDFYYRSASVGIRSVDVRLEHSLKTAGIFLKEQAEVIAKKYGGKVLKVKLELEEV